MLRGEFKWWSAKALRLQTLMKGDNKEGGMFRT